MATLPDGTEVTITLPDGTIHHATALNIGTFGSDMPGWDFALLKWMAEDEE